MRDGQSTEKRRARLPLKMKVGEAVTKALEIDAMLPIASLKRLSESLSAEAGELRVTMTFDSHRIAHASIRGQISGLLPLICQRSLEVFQWPLQVSYHWLLVHNEAQEERLLGEADPVWLVDEQFLLHEAVEDEVLLALPLVPIAPDSRPPAAAPKKKPGQQTKAPAISDNIQLDDSQPNPFAALKGQLPKR